MNKQKFEDNVSESFNIDSNKQYFFDTLYDAFGLYSIIDWVNEKRKTFKKKNHSKDKNFSINNIFIKFKRFNCDCVSVLWFLKLQSKRNNT